MTGKYRTILTKKELNFYIKADRMMNRGCFKWSFRDKLFHIINPDYIMKFLETLRKAEYYSWRHGRMLQYYYKMKLQRLGIKLGFTIALHVFGYGLVIPHYGTIVVGSGNKIGNYAVLHTCICITAGEKDIGDGLYVSTGARILGDVKLGNYVTIGANAVVNKPASDNVLFVGIPAVHKREGPAWHSGNYQKRFEACEELRKQIFN